MSMPGAADDPYGTRRDLSEGLLSLLVESIVDYAIFVLDTDGNVVTWNPGAERLKGWPAGEIIGRHFSTFYTAEDREQGLPGRGLGIAREQGRWEHHGWRVRRDGSRFWADVVITALRSGDGTLRGFAKITRDLTDRKRNEDALVAVLRREQEAAEQLRELDRMKSDLVAIVAHDLRGPVGVLQSLLGVLEEGWTEMADEQRFEIVQRMAQRSTSLAALVDDVFDLARIEAGQIDVVPDAFDLAEVVDHVVADAAVSSPDREVRCTSAGDTTAWADRRRTWQIVMNLVQNALKYSPMGSGVEVHTSRADDRVVVSVRDQGPGIAPEDQELAFSRFGRLPGTSSAPGSGLGLFIARSFAEAQGGALELDSAAGAGSTFRLLLPAVRSTT